MIVLEQNDMQAHIQLDKQDISDAVVEYLRSRGFIPKPETLDFVYTHLDATIEVQLPYETKEKQHGPDINGSS